jgi:hypothetical protein
MMTKDSERSIARVPAFADEQEAAAFWDSHSPLDFPEEFEEVEVAIGRSTRKRGLTVKLDQATIDRLTAIAEGKGIGPSTLARMWILEHLQALPPESASKRAW